MPGSPHGHGLCGYFDRIENGRYLRPPESVEKEAGSMSELIEIKQDDAIAKVALKRPEAYNAFNYEMISQLADHFVIKCVVGFG
jgi:hypothetical protein